jgi:hypothetical protein
MFLQNGNTIQSSTRVFETTDGKRVVYRCERGDAAVEAKQKSDTLRPEI